MSNLFKNNKRKEEEESGHPSVFTEFLRCGRALASGEGLGQKVKSCQSHEFILSA